MRAERQSGGNRRRDLVSSIFYSWSASTVQLQSQQPLYAVHLNCVFKSSVQKSAGISNAHFTKVSMCVFYQPTALVPSRAEAGFLKHFWPKAVRWRSDQTWRALLTVVILTQVFFFFFFHIFIFFASSTQILASIT